jgi:hypothetical protein
MRLCFFVGLMALVIGCARAPDFCRVSGQVSFQSAPLAEGSIQFFSTGEHSGPAGGALIKDGVYQLPAEHGLKPGSYRVFITSPESMPELKTPEMSVPPVRERIPPKFNSESQIEIEVRSGQVNAFDFTIE